jgi:flagellar biosynthesis chaperone FliJ
MRPRNPFSGLLRIRSVRERQARGDLAAAQAHYAEARQALQELTEQLRKEAPIEDRLTPEQLTGLRMRGIRSVELLEEAAAAYEDAEQRRREQTDRWRRAASDLDAAEKLHRRRKDEIARTAALAGEKALDELVITLRHRRSG